mmetsp:Transcript_60169/g.143416  ORF Transcript_60169/g.143416 Transcript_60169/m.143416 type:complete len:238 (-) Transcript_60169:45-758(-)
MGQEASAERINARDIWQAYDLDDNGQLSRPEVEKLLQSILRHYGAESRINAAFVDGVMKELDVNENGIIEQEEFEALFDELWAHHSELFRSKAKAAGPPGKQPNAVTCAGGASRAPPMPAQPAAAPYPFPQVRPPADARVPMGQSSCGASERLPTIAGDALHCPHCAFEIDPRDLERLRVSPEVLQACHDAWDSQVSSVPLRGPAGPGLPTGMQSWGRVPPSFFHGSNIGWGQSSTR